jgi:hypothetical protein
MKESLESFLPQVPDLATKKPAELIKYFVYFLTTIEGNNVARTSEIERCFEVARLPKYSNISAYLSRNSKIKKYDYCFCSKESGIITLNT